MCVSVLVTTWAKLEKVYGRVFRKVLTLLHRSSDLDGDLGCGAAAVLGGDAGKAYGNG